MKKLNLDNILEESKDTLLTRVEYSKSEPLAMLCYLACEHLGYITKLDEAYLLTYCPYDSIRAYINSKGE